MQRNKFLIGFVIVFSILITSFVFYFYQVFFSENILVEKGDQLIVIEEDMDFQDLQDIVYDKGIVNDMLSFSFVAKLLDYQENMKPGLYLMKKDMTNLQAVRMLRAGEQIPTTTTFNNVRLKSDLAGKITDNLQADSVEFLALLNNDSLVTAYGFTQDNILSMFIPNTYEVYYTISEQSLFDKMYAEYQRFWTEERKRKAEVLGLSPTEVSALASIVQAETIQPDERPKVAEVYLNRLERNMLLQADPALVYAVGDFTIKRVLNVHKEVDSPYNLYRYKGLPPGPINLPEIESIDAVLNPDEHNYLYFCAKPDFSGYHAFATNLRQHNVNARAYQNALNRSNIYK
ncbi:aminodeoxychorismate lyase [Marivirga tractuosa]|uniref:Endolytic murein transglycosylase n=1 Tax=Marivirga tractuosa (strain ATCC 23168 / DSM 4126 / NBRC 15989 / NCIMB 1408 / VKM B-1430 / H-43) TaxID=643867 RepID=E4TQZ5_MARTH|nr:endolytic transglycosylase MltG [Marivirga tractuosa]ADR21695.1 aminodeoxychorismate lyase [Marivirga tractuosa DSM 4126]BDD13847.1 aminodeoxychorismate lyase [Marivirga tractuosa]